MKMEVKITSKELSEQLRVDEIINILARKIKNMSNEKDRNYYLNTSRKNLLNQYNMMEVEDSFPYTNGMFSKDAGVETIEGLIELIKGEEWNNKYLNIDYGALKFLEDLGFVETRQEKEYSHKYVKGTENLKLFMKEFEQSNHKYNFYAVNKELKNLVYTEILKYEPIEY
jgi:hypothetical protein